MNQPDERRELLDRIEQRLPEYSIREVAMFGTMAIMVNDAMLVAVSKDLSLLVRVAPNDDPQLMNRPEATRPEMGAGRSMGTGWIRVDLDPFADDATLDFWLHYAIKRREAARRGMPCKEIQSRS